MADLSITAASVGLANESGAQIQVVKYGEAITQGQPLYLNDSTEKYYATNAATSEMTADAKGIALTPGGTNDFGVMVRDGAIDLGATLTVGETYIVSGAASGGIAPIGDITTGWRVTILGVAEAADRLELKVTATGVERA